MQREIKFRGWDGATMWYEDFAIDSKGGQPFWIDDGIRTELTVMQFTGLKDKNGKEIYEGDIYQRPAHCQNCAKRKEKNLFTISFNHGAFIMLIEGERLSGNDNWVRLGSKFNLENGEVIGNVWENPELIK